MNNSLIFLESNNLKTSVQYTFLKKSLNGQCPADHSQNLILVKQLLHYLIIFSIFLH